MIPSAGPWPRAFLVLCLGALWGLATAVPATPPEWYETLRKRFQDQVNRAPDSALVTAEECLRRSERAGDGLLVARSWSMLGQAWNMKGHAEKALPHFQRALTGMEAQGDVYGTAMINANLADVYGSQRQWEAAARHGRRAVAGFKECRQPIWEAASMEALALAMVALGRDDSARVLLDLAAPILEQMNVKDHVDQIRHVREGLGDEPMTEVDKALPEGLLGLRAELAMGRSLHALGVEERALTTLRKALADATRMGYDQERMEGHEALAELLAATGNAQEAYAHLQQFSVLKDSLDSHRTAVAVAELQERFEGARKDVTLHEQQLVISRQRSWLIGAAAVLLLLGAGLFAAVLWRRRERAHGAVVALRNAELNQALSEKELLLQEVHHRVKNNLQMVGGLLRMQDRLITDPTARQAMRDGQDRVRCMALIHQDLFGDGNARGIDMAGYVDKLAKGLLRSHGLDRERITLHVEVDPLHLDVDSAVPIGLILNELIVNALKHAFPDGRAGTLHIALRHAADGLHLEVSDDGVGLAVEALNEEGGGGFGLAMLRTFAEKLQADHETIGGRGTTVRMHIREYRMAV